MNSIGDEIIVGIDFGANLQGHAIQYNFVNSGNAPKDLCRDIIIADGNTILNDEETLEYLK